MCVSWLALDLILTRIRDRDKDNLLWIYVEGSDSDKEQPSDAKSWLIIPSYFTHASPLLYIDVFIVF